MTLPVEIQTFMASQVDKVVPKHRISFCRAVQRLNGEIAS